MQIILFDIDSTLLVDGGAATEAFEIAFSELFSCVPVKIDKHGMTDPFIVREIAFLTLQRSISQEEENALHLRYSMLYPSFLKSNSNFRVLDGADHLCRKLNSITSVVLGIQTGNIEPCAWEKLKRAGLDHYFKFGGFGSDHEERSQIVRKGIERGLRITNMPISECNVFVIGDSIHDIKAGLTNKAITIGVSTGKHNTEELLLAGANAVFTDLTDTEAICQLLLSDTNNNL